MKSLFILLVCCVISIQSDEECYSSTAIACDGLPGNEGTLTCNTLYGGFFNLAEPLRNYAVDQLQQSYDYILFAAHFGHYTHSRPGFKKLFMELSDKMWENSLSIIKHTTKRGGSMSFGRRRATHRGQIAMPTYHTNVTEIVSVAYALDTQKELAMTAHKIHGLAVKQTDWEPEITSYLEENFMHQQADDIRKLAGYSNDLKNLFKQQRDPSLSMFMFDNYLTSA